MICKSCGDTFQGYNSSRYCAQVKTRDCISCGEDFQQVCGRRLARTCSPSCAAKARRKVTRSCERCGVEFLGSSTQRFCHRVIEGECARCGRSFSHHCDSYSRKTAFCDSICWNLADSFNTELIHEYRSIDDWARLFAQSRGRKPAVHDVRSYFGVRNIPVHATRELFAEPQVSYLEETVLETIQEVSGSPILRNTRPLRTAEGRVLEIDFLLPDLSVGFEVQDLSTHSKDSDREVGRFGVKHGPQYHSLKRQLAEELGITLVELWEDEILRGEHLEIIRQAVGAADAQDAPPVQ